MNRKKRYLIKTLMIIGGIIMIIGGFLSIFADGQEITSKLIIDKLVFFLSGGFVLFLGVKWKRNELKKINE